MPDILSFGPVQIDPEEIIVEEDQRGRRAARQRSEEGGRRDARDGQRRPPRPPPPAPRSQKKRASEPERARKNGTSIVLTDFASLADIRMLLPPEEYIANSALRIRPRQPRGVRMHREADTIEVCGRAIEVVRVVKATMSAPSRPAEFVSELALEDRLLLRAVYKILDFGFGVATKLPPEEIN